MISAFVFAALVGSALGGTLMDMGSDMQQIVVDDHNRIRGEVQPPADSMEEMTWNNELAALAQVWAKKLADGCGGIGHDGKADRTPDNYVNMGASKAGQNVAYIAWGVRGELDVTERQETALREAMGGWEEEKSCWEWGQQATCTVGHYTQQIWDWSSEVGCAMAHCSKNSGGWDWYKVYTVCNYFPGGNLARTEDGRSGGSNSYGVPYIKKSSGTTELKEAPCKGWAAFNYYDSNSCFTYASSTEGSGCPTASPGNLVCGCARHCGLCNSNMPQDKSENTALGNC